VDVLAVHPVQMEPIVAREGLLFGIKALGQDARQLVHRLAADLEDDQLEHVVLHGRVARRLPVPDPARDKDVEVGRDDAELAVDFVFAVTAPERRQKDRVLESEIVLGVEVDCLQTFDHRFRCTADVLIPAPVEREIVLDEAAEGRTAGEAKRCLVIPHPAVELRADQVEVAGLGSALALSNALCVLTAKPGLDCSGILFLAKLLQ